MGGGSAMRTLGVILAVGILGYGALVAAAWALQRQLIYLPTAAAPGAPGGNVEEVQYSTADGLELDAWFVPTDGEPHATVLVANGNAGHREFRLPFAEALADRGYAVLLTDYRGYGGNPGSPDEGGLVADISAGMDYLHSRDDVDADRVVAFGESLGGGPVAAVASDVDPAAIVLRSPFPKLADVGTAHYSFLPVRTLLRDRFPVVENLGCYEGPVLVVAGTADRVVPTALSREVAQSVGAQLTEISGADHNDRELLDGQELLDSVDTFLRDEIP